MASLVVACLQQDKQSRTIKAYLAVGVAMVLHGCWLMGGRDLGTAMILVFIGGVAFLIVGFPGKWMGSAYWARWLWSVHWRFPARTACVVFMATYGDCSAADAQAYATSPFTASTPSPPEVFWDWASAIRGRNGITCRPPITISFFAIIGEETGFVGCAIVLLFFAILAWCMIVIALQVTDRYVAMVLMCVTIWIVGQAMVNIGVVVVCSRYWACLCRSSPQVAHP